MNREILAGDFAAATSRNRWKTFVLEAHPDHDVEYLLADAFADSKVEATDDVYLHRLAGEVDFVVDHLDQRFWSLHTTNQPGRPRRISVVLSTSAAISTGYGCPPTICAGSGARITAVGGR